MKDRSVGSTIIFYLILQTLCGLVTALWLDVRHFSGETTDWSVPAFLAYVSQLTLSVALIRTGQCSLISNLAKSFLALLMSFGVMVLSSYLSFRKIHRPEFQGVDYFAAFAIYALTIPGQLIVSIGGPILLAIRNARARPVIPGLSASDRQKSP